MFVGGCWLLLEVVIVGSYHCMLFLCIVGGWRWLLSFIVCVDGDGKKKGSHVTHCDNGIMFEFLHEITCK